MKRNFTNDDLSICVYRHRENKLVLTISSLFSQSDRKSQLYVSEKGLSEEVEQLWKKIRTRKLQHLRVSFDEVDYYTSLSDMYTTPILFMERGKRKPVICTQSHGSIPKEWNIGLRAEFNDMTTKGPIFEVIKNTLGTKFTPSLEKKLSKDIKSILQKKRTHVEVYED